MSHCECGDMMFSRSARKYSSSQSLPDLEKSMSILLMANTNCMTRGQLLVYTDDHRKREMLGITGEYKLLLIRDCNNLGVLQFFCDFRSRAKFCDLARGPTHPTPNSTGIAKHC